jgi:hypothetical protein
MTDEELIREGKAGRFLCSPMANFGKPPRKVFVVQLEEVKAEWRRRLAVNAHLDSLRLRPWLSLPLFVSLF